MEREVGGGIGMGNTCKPMAVSFQCMTKFTTNKKYMYKKKRWKKSWHFFVIYFIYTCTYIPGGSVVKNLHVKAGNTGLIPGLGNDP